MAETKSFLRFFLNCKKRFRYYNRKQIEKYQLTNGKQVVQYAIENAPFFKRHYKDYKIDDVWNLPTVNKKIMMENLSDYNTLNFNKEELLKFLADVERTRDYSKRYKGYSVAMSSGTSGNKGVVINSPAEEKYLQAVFFSRFVFPTVLKIRWAFLLRVTAPAFNVKKFGQQMTHFSLMMSLEDMVSQLQKFQPNILSAPPSMLKILAKEITNGHLNIKPKRVISYAEVLTPEVKSEIEEVFNTKLHQIYQGSEGSIAMTCKHGSLHINEDLINVQTLDSKGSPTQSGEPCYKMIVTDLHKKSQPIIRFELNDIIVISGDKCPCGSSFKVIDQIMGRADDLLWAPRKNTNELQFVFPDYIHRAIINSSEYIDEYQVIQRSFSKVVVKLLTKIDNINKEQLKSIVELNIKNVFHSYNCEEPSIEVRFEPPIKNPYSNKLIRIFRDFSIENK